jgi:nucleotide-binding universal stress UspA family protein
MGPIVCATRGGEASRRAQERAIQLAKERGVELVFLYVVDLSFAGALDEVMAVTLADELRRLGRCLLHIAEARALESGLDAKIVVQEGTVQSVVEDFVRKVDASALVIGSPQSGPEPQMFDQERLGKFAAAVREATGVEVVVAE